MAKDAKLIKAIREKIRRQEYELTVPHFFEEMANDDLILADIESAIADSAVRRRFAVDPRGMRYDVVGEATDGRRVAVICHFKETGKLLLITTWVLE